MTRRRFARTAAVSLAAVAAAALPRPLAAAPAAPPPRRSRIALTPGSIGVSVNSQRELVDLAHRHRFEAVEPRGDELAATPSDALAALNADLAAKNLAWAAAGLPVDFRKDDATFRTGLAKLPAYAASLQRAGATRIGTWLSPSHAELTYRANFTRHTARLREVAAILRDHGLRLGLEYVGTQLNLVGQRYPFVHTLAETRELIAAIGTGNVGLVLDTWHWWTARDTAADLASLTAADVVSVDLNDAPVGLAREQQKDNSRELPGATGVIDVAPFVAALVAMDYDGPIRPEPFNAALNALDNDPACAASSAALLKVLGPRRA